MNEVRDENGLFIVRKMCKEIDACQNHESQNPSQCRRGENINSLCYYCCDTDLCNYGDYLDVTTVAITTQSLPDPTTDAMTSSQVTTVPLNPTTQALMTSPDHTTWTSSVGSTEPTTYASLTTSLDPTMTPSGSSVTPPSLGSEDSSTVIVQTTMNQSQEASCNEGISKDVIV